MKSKTDVLNEVFEPTEDIPLYIAIQLSCGEEEIYKCMDAYAKKQAEAVIKEMEEINGVIGTPHLNHAINLIKKHFNIA